MDSDPAVLFKTCVTMKFVVDDDDDDDDDDWVSFKKPAVRQHKHIRHLLPYRVVQSEPQGCI